MKTKILNHVAIVLLLAGSFFSCEKRAETGGEVPYKTCCDKEKRNRGLDQGEAFLFKDSISKQVLDKIYSDKPRKEWQWIVFDTKTGNAQLSVCFLNYPWFKILKICNFPDFVRDWKITENGCKVYYEGIIYESCFPTGGIAINVQFDFVLSRLIRK